MSKKEAYRTIMFLLNEASDNLDCSDFQDLKAVAGMLETVIYLTKSFQLDEKDEIYTRVLDIRSKAYRILHNIENTLDNLF